MLPPVHMIIITNLHFYLNIFRHLNFIIYTSIHTISYGKRKRTINCDLFAHYKSNLILEYYRFQCKDCNHFFSDSTNIILKGERIAKSTKINILLDLKEDHTFKYIAQKNNISLQTVIDILESHIKPVRKILPEVICIDEFKNLRTADGKYAFRNPRPFSSQSCRCSRK